MMLISGLPHCLHVGLHPEAGVQVRVRGEGGDEGLRHVHPLQVAGEELDLERPGGIARGEERALRSSSHKMLKRF